LIRYLLAYGDGNITVRCSARKRSVCWLPTRTRSSAIGLPEIFARPELQRCGRHASETRYRRRHGTLSVRVARLRGSYCSAPLPVSMHSTEKDRLLNASSETAKLYSFAVLNTMRPVSTKDDYDDARRLSEDALDQCNTARAELNWHIALHGC